MHTVIRVTVFGLCMFILGFALGNMHLAKETFDNNPPIAVDFCFLLRNPDLIGARRFVTNADIASAYPHGSVLESSACPSMGVPFAEKLDNQDFAAELDRKFHGDPYNSVSISFEGTLYRPNLFHRLWFSIAPKLGLSGDRTAPITIRAYKAVAN